MADTAEAQDSPIRAPRHTPHVPPPPQNSLRDVNYRESFVGPASSGAAASTLPTTFESPSPAAKVAVKDSNEKESSGPRVTASTTNTPMKSSNASSNSNSNTPGPTGSAAVAVASGIYRAGSFRMTAPAPLRKESSGITNGGSSKNNTATGSIAAAPVVTSAAASGESIADAEGGTSATSAGSGGDRPAPMVSRKSINAGASSFKSPYTTNANTNTSNATPTKSRKSIVEKVVTATVASAGPVDGAVDGDAGAQETRPAAEVAISSTKTDSFATPKKGNMATSGTIVSQTASKIVSTPQNVGAVVGGAAESKSAIAPRRPGQPPTNNETARSALRNSRYGSLQKGTSSATAGAGASAEQKGDENNLDSDVSTPMVTKSGKPSAQTEDVGSLTPSTPDKATSAAKTPSFKRASFVKKPSATK